MNFNELYTADKKRYKGKLNIYLRSFFFLFRKSQTAQNSILKKIYTILFRFVALSRGIEILPECKIGKGLYLGHAYNITVNGGSVIGNNCNLHKGIVIGQQNRGRLKGVPTIGNEVWIGINAAIVGNVTIGDDVLIAPNSYVNCDVPPHSVVYGNPCVVKPRTHATEDYINNKA